MVCNHRSIIDPMALMVAVPHRITFLAAAYLFKIPVVGLVLKLSGALPVNAEKEAVVSIRKGLQKLKSGKVIGLFPEGGVSFDNKLKPFHAGWAYLALKSGTPVLPAAICGSSNMLPPRTYIPRRRQVTINFGALISVEKKSKIAQEDLALFNQKLVSIILQLIDACQQQRL